RYMKIKFTNKVWFYVLISLNTILLVLLNLIIKDEGLELFKPIFAGVIILVNILYFLKADLYNILSKIIGLINVSLVLLWLFFGISIELSWFDPRIISLIFMFA